MVLNKNACLVTNILFLLLLDPLNVGAKEVDFGNYYALLIGNQKYDYNNDWKNLNTPHADVDILAKLLKKSFGFKVLIKKDLNRGEIIDLIEYYKKKLSDRDNLLIYYAGHGHLRKDGGYWIGVEGKKNSRGDWLKYTTISDLLDKKTGMNAKHVLVIADSCYAGAAYRGNNDRSKHAYNESNTEWIKRMVESPTRRILSSGGEHPVIDQVGNDRHSVFANELLDTLTQIAEKKEIQFTQDLYKSIAPEVYHRTKRYGKAQTPNYKKIPGTGDRGGDFIFKPLLSKPIFVKKYKDEKKTPPGLATRAQPTTTSRNPNNDARHWKELSPLGPKGLNFYLSLYPNGFWADEARTRLEAVRGVRLPELQETKLRLTAQEQAQALYEWQNDIRYSNSSQIIEQFILKFPVGSHMPDVKRRLEDLRARGR